MLGLGRLSSWVSQGVPKVRAAIRCASKCLGRTMRQIPALALTYTSVTAAKLMVATKLSPRGAWR